MSWPYSEVVLRTIDALEKGIGHLLQPLHITRIERAKTDAEIERSKRLTANKADLEALQKGEKKLDPKYELVPVTPMAKLDNPTEQDAFGQFVEAANQHAMQVNLKRAFNLSMIADFAMQEAHHLEEKKQIKDDNNKEKTPSHEYSNVDDDWISKWRNSAQDISKEAMQRVWGRILAGEAASPGSFSLHTLDFLNRVSVEEAELINRLAPFCLADCIPKLPTSSIFWEKIGFNNLLHLNSLGLIGGMGSPGLSQTYGIKKENGIPIAYIRIDNHVIRVIFSAEDRNKELSISAYSISKILKEILILHDVEKDSAVYDVIKSAAIASGAVKTQIGDFDKKNQIIGNLRDI